MAQSHAYSPTAEQPYQPYEAQQPTPAAPPIAAAQEPGFRFTGAPNTTLGNVAGALDNIFRGYMRGKQEGEAKKVMQIKAKTDNLQNSYNQDAQIWLQMKASGVNPDSAEFKQATSAVNGSWGALNEWVGSHVNGEDTKSGKKSKKAQQQQSDPLADLRSEDPNVRTRALFQLHQKMGPPVFWQGKQLDTPEAVAARKAQATSAQAAEVGAGKKLTAEQAEKQRNDVLAIPEDQRTDAQKAQLKSAEEILTLPAKATTEFEQTRASIARKVAEDPNYVLTDSEKNVLGGGKPTYPKPPGAAGGLKEGSFGSFLVKQFGEHPTGEDYLKARRMWAVSGHVAGGGSGGAGSSDKTYQKWHAYYKEHYPGMGDDELDSLTRRKVEGAGQLQAGQVGFDAATQPEQFDSDVISQAIDNVRKLPQYSGNTPSIKYFDDALANIVGLGDNGYQYHGKQNLGQPDSSGKFAGDVTQDQLKNLERDLQTQIRVILSKQTGLPPDQKRAAAQRMAPLFGPAATYGPEPAVPRSGNPPASPPAAAATHPAPASSPGSGGLPPEAAKHLKAGSITTFGNGQQWTLDEHGNPKQVK